MAAKVNCMVVHGGVLCKWEEHRRIALYYCCWSSCSYIYMKCVKSFATIICDKCFLKWDSNSLKTKYRFPFLL